MSFLMTTCRLACVYKALYKAMCNDDNITTQQALSGLNRNGIK